MLKSEEIIDYLISSTPKRISTECGIPIEDAVEILSQASDSLAFKIIKRYPAKAPKFVHDGIFRERLKRLMDAYGVSEGIAEWALNSFKPSLYPILTDREMDLKQMEEKSGLSGRTLLDYRYALIKIDECEKREIDEKRNERNRKDLKPRKRKSNNLDYNPISEEMAEVVRVAKSIYGQNSEDVRITNISSKDVKKECDLSIRRISVELTRLNRIGALKTSSFNIKERLKYEFPTGVWDGSPKEVYNRIEKMLKN